MEEVRHEDETKLSRAERKKVQNRVNQRAFSE